MLDDPLNPAAADDAVVFAPWVEVLGASPGNCTADCGLIDGEALMPGAAAPADPSPVVTGPPAGTAANDVEAFDELALDEITADESAPQPSAIERLPMNEPPVEQGVPGRLAPLTVVASKVPVAEEAVLDDVPVADVLVADVVPLGAVLCETT
jgi:hypothetical protein